MSMTIVVGVCHKVMYIEKYFKLNRCARNRKYVIITKFSLCICVVSFQSSLIHLGCYIVVLYWNTSYMSTSLKRLALACY